MSIRSSGIVLIVFVFLSTGCVSNRREETIFTPTPLISPSTSQATQTLAPSATMTPLPPQASATQGPVEGVALTQINVRAEPSTASNVLGIIPANTKVEITGKDPGENWWQINYPQGIDGKGWVTAQYITTTTKPEVPLIGGSVQADPKNANVAIVQQQLNVRSGPGTDFNSLGTLNPRDVVGLVGKDANGVWLQINFANGPEGKGWVSAAFVRAQGVENLPIVTETGLIVGTRTPTGIPFTPTPTLIPAWDDQDAADNPVASVIFEARGTQTLIYNGELSSPAGDAQDWVAFKPDSSWVFVSLECKGGDPLKIEITENNLPMRPALACGDHMKPIPVKAGNSYLIHLQVPGSTQNLQYTNYILTIKTRPS